MDLRGQEVPKASINQNLSKLSLSMAGSSEDPWLIESASERDDGH